MNARAKAFGVGKSTFSGAVRAGDYLFVSGMTATDERRQVVGNGTAAQARYIYSKMSAVLAEAGASLDDVVQTTDYITTLEGYAETAVVRREVFGDGPFPAATGVVVAGLVRPEALIEISAVAWLGGQS